METVETEDESEEGDTNLATRVVTFKASAFCFNLIIHELYHVYSFYSCTDFEMGISNHDMEEIHARINERYLLKIVKNACIIFKELTKSSPKLINSFQKSAERMEHVWTSLDLAAKKKSGKTRQRRH
jgi:hypothetical protein